MNIDLHQMLEKIQKENLITRYLEIGSREGDSLEKIIKDNVHIQEVFISDLWGYTYGGSGRRSHEHILKLLARNRFNGTAFFLDGDSKKTIPRLHDSYTNYFDLILVDGDHSYYGAMRDLENVFDLCKSEGLIVFDDITHPDHKYLEKCFDVFVYSKKDLILKSEKIHYGCGIGIIQKK